MVEPIAFEAGPVIDEKLIALVPEDINAAIYYFGIAAKKEPMEKFGDETAARLAELRTLIGKLVYERDEMKATCAERAPCN